MLQNIVTAQRWIIVIYFLHCLFFGRGGWRSGNYGGHWKNRGQQYKKQMEEKLKNMTPEEREKFRVEWRKRCGWRHQSREENKIDSETAEN